MKRLSFLLAVFLAGESYIGPIFAQNRYNRLEMGLDEVIQTAREQSVAATLAKHNFIVSYWQFRTYKAQFLPSVNLEANLGQYNRSLTMLQNSETGERNYVNNNTLQNEIGLSVRQNLPFSGGSVSVYSSLNRLDQYAPERMIRYNSQPVYISYNQPIKAFNSLKWEKKIEPKQYELAKKIYLERMESITSLVVGYFFDLLIAQQRLAVAEQSLENTQLLYKIAQERFSIGTISQNELLQLQLRLLNDELSIRDNRLTVEMQMIKLRNYLGFNESVELVLKMPPVQQDMVLDVDEVMMKMDRNSSFALTNEIDRLEAEQEVARARANNGLQASLYAQFGLNQVGNDLKSAYRSPIDQEVFGLQLSLPILDWGRGRGKVKVAKSRHKVIEMQIEQSEIEKREDVVFKVLQFNMQGPQCSVSARADTVGRQSYESARERFLNGAIGVMELNNAQSEMDQASIRYLTDLSNYWQYYYNIRQMTLFDYIKNENLTEDFDRLSGEKVR